MSDEQAAVFYRRIASRSRRNNTCLLPYGCHEACSATLTRREIVRANASLGELRRDKKKLSSPITCEFVRVKAS